MTKSFYIKDNISSAEKIRQRRQFLTQLRHQDLIDIYPTPFDINKVDTKNCENLIGSISIPLGITGPLQINSPDFEAKDKVLIPLATTEGALVASVSRGIKIANLSNGIDIDVKRIGMTRAPVYQLADSNEAAKFEKWLKDNFEQIALVSQSTSNHLKLLSIKTWIKDKYVFARFVFDTDQAMGMNMVTIALQHLYDVLISTQTNAQMLTVSSNLCTDKKQSVINMELGRGYSAKASVIISNDNLEKYLKVSAEQLLKTFYVKNVLGSSLAGSTYSNMQVANVVAAIFAATGQDLAHIVEASQANTHIKATKNEVRFSLKMPDLPIGVIGGGNYLPAQQSAKDLIRESGKLSSLQLAGVIAAASLAGEISGLAALSNNSLAQAHQQLGR